MNNTYLRAQQLRKKDAKFPFVKIGTQYWTLKNHDLSVTPQGTTIKEMQANGNVEKITNAADREFSSDTGFWNKSADANISGGLLNKVGTATNYFADKVFPIIPGKLYKITYTRNVTGGNVCIRFTGGTNTNLNYRSENGTFTDFIMANVGNTTIQIVTNVFSVVGSIDNVSIQEIGWAGSQELYDGVYAQTSGTVEQKTYAAVKAAAMWCHYNNDVAIGVVYGKLYNWFAVKLIQMDIDYYNAANPNKKWGGGWRIYNDSDGTSLISYLGGNTLAGGAMKEIGTANWLTPNYGATNLSGLSLVGCGLRAEDGSFNNIGSRCILWSITEVSNLVAKYSIFSKSDDSTSIPGSSNKTRGYSIRLIKA